MIGGTIFLGGVEGWMVERRGFWLVESVNGAVVVGQTWLQGSECGFK